MTDSPAPSVADLVRAVVGEMLQRHPETATSLGEHRYDDRLHDRSADALADDARWLRGRLAALADQRAARDTSVSDHAGEVDAEILRNALELRLFELEELREHEWDPLVANPGTALYALLARDFAPLGDRLRSVASRLTAVPEVLRTARKSLGAMPRVHVETAIGQLTGTRTLIATELERALVEEPALRAEVEPARERAVDALDEHVDWLRAQLKHADRDPRLGAPTYGRKLALTLDTASDADAVLARAEGDLAEIEDRIAATAARLDRGPAEGRVRRVLDRLAADGHVDNSTIVGLCQQSLVETTEFVREHDLVTVHDDPVEIIVMPEIHRGVAVAYCDPPGPLESASLPTYFAVSPTPEDWTEERVGSFFREYNAHMLANLTVHEAMPGHVLQLAHNNRYASEVPVRKAFWSHPFVEGWAVYAEELMADAGYRGDANDALRMQQLKMALRMTINAILDARVHAHGMTEDEAMRLMMERGHQEEGEAAGKWRRALLTSAQLSTYYVGYVEVRDLARDLGAARPGTSVRERHDAMLGHGSPPPRHLRTLLGLRR